MGAVMFARAALAAALLLLAGCTSSGVWFATTRMNMTDYRKQEIVVLPVSTLPGIEIDDATKLGLQNAVIKGLRTFRVKVDNVRVVSDADLAAKDAATRFPWTPARLAATAAALDSGADATIAAAIGISITGTTPRQGKEPATLSVMIVFADKADPNDKRWAMAGTWSDKKFSDIVSHVEDELGSYFIDLKWLARTGGRLLVREVYDTKQPFVTVFGPKGIFGDRATTVDNRLSLQIIGVHDDGIDTVEVRNESANFSVKLKPPAKDPHDKGPIYYSDRVNVPLQFGPNTIRVSAISSAGEVTERLPVKIDRLSPPRVRLVSVGVSDYDSLDPVFGAAEAARKVYLAGAKAGTDTASSGVASLLVDKGASRSVTNQTLNAATRSTAIDDQLVFYFAGRLVTIQGRGVNDQAKFYFALRDASTGAPGVGSFSTADLARFLLSQAGQSVAVLDVCGNEAAEGFNDTLRQALPRNVVFNVSPCDASVGQLGNELAGQWKSVKRNTANIAVSANDIASHVQGSQVGAQSLEIAAGEDGAER